MKLQKQFTTVTPFSKFLAMFLFITLPFFGFYLGLLYQKRITVTPTTTEPIAIYHSSKTNTPNSNWKTYTSLTYSFKYPAMDGWEEYRFNSPLGDAREIKCKYECKNATIDSFSIGPLIYKTLDEYKNAATTYLLDIQDVTVNGLPGVRTIHTGERGGSATSAVKYFIVHKGIGYELSYEFPIQNLTNFSQFPPPQPDILSTVKFID